jgi:F-type H+/Na+-transporting ATPase subunit alpha
MKQDTYQYYLDTYNEYGEVVEVNYPIVTIIGLPSAKLNEIVVFETNDRGQIIGLHDDQATVLLFSKKRLKTGTKLSRTNSHIAIPLGDMIRGTMIDPFGQSLLKNNPPLEQEEIRIIDMPPQGISGRIKIEKPLATGTAVVDMMIPLGKGQRELILGDRKTGKSTFMINTIKNQIREGTIAVVALIGKKAADIKEIESFMQNERIKDNMVVVATSAFDSPGLIYLTPFTAMTIAEYFRDKGKNVLLIMDDLLTHAKFYREYSLIAQTFPGRDSYPADIFHVHARLLERAGNFKHTETGQVAITCLPIVETQEGDFTGYIVSNLMSITDGHLFFDTNVFAQGRRPAINIPLSVTRVGKQTQDRILKDINRELSSLFSIYQRVENLSHFGSEMTESVKSIFATGDKVYNFFNQPANMLMDKEVALILFSLIWLQKLTTQQSVEEMRGLLIKACEQEENRLFLKSLLNIETFNQLLKNVTDYETKILSLCKPTNK